MCRTVLAEALLLVTKSRWPLMLSRATCFLLGIGGPTHSLWILLALLAAGIAFGALAQHHRAS